MITIEDLEAFQGQAPLQENFKEIFKCLELVGYARVQLMPEEEFNAIYDYIVGTQGPESGNRLLIDNVVYQLHDTWYNTEGSYRRMTIGNAIFDIRETGVSYGTEIYLNIRRMEPETIRHASLRPEDVQSTHMILSDIPITNNPSARTSPNGFNIWARHFNMACLRPFGYKSKFCSGSTRLGIETTPRNNLKEIQDVI